MDDVSQGVIHRKNPGVQSRCCYEISRHHGKPVFVTEPCRGGTLALCRTRRSGS